MIQNFTHLIAWQKSHELVLNIYKILKKLPNEEKFALADQMRRSSISITSNIAEGFSKNTKKDKVQFYTISKGSLSELQS
jgi:four helix bundle protein